MREHPLAERAPGSGARKMAAQRYRARLILVIPCVVACCYILSRGVTVNSLPPLVACLVSLLVIDGLRSKILDPLRNAERRAGRDAEAEEKVGALLNRLPEEYAVLHADEKLRRPAFHGLTPPAFGATCRCTMFEKRFYVEGLAHASYLVGAGGEAAVIDPKRDVEDYLQTAEQEGLKIVAVLETHPHADFVSGHVELARRTGARIYVSHLAPASYERVRARDGDVIRIGPLEILVLETPGHSPDSLSFVVREQGTPVRVYTGDTLFAGDVGRPDLRDAEEKPTRLAGALYDSLFEKLLRLPAEVKVFPAHGAGSLCGRKISTAPFTTIGQERGSNWALQISDRAQFVRTMVENLPDRPQYFSYGVATNLAGAPPLSSLPELRAFSESDLKAAAAGAVVIDTRSAPFFGAGHFPGSLSIGLSSSLFATWVGFFVPVGQPIVLVAGSADSARKARLELARIGYDNLLGYFEADALTQVQHLSQLGVEELHAALRRGEAPRLLDVRTAGEWEAGHIEKATHIPLPAVPGRAGELNKDAPLAVLCGSGYRSSIAASLLQARGFTRVQNVMGGMEAYLESRPPEWQPSDLIFFGENI